MYCYQCEQTTRTGDVLGCTVSPGNCGKTEQTSNLQDVLLYALKGVAQYNKRARELGVADDAASRFILESLFATLTNVNFDAGRFVQMLHECSEIRARVRASYEAAARATGVEIRTLVGPAVWRSPFSANDLLAEAYIGAIRKGVDQVGEDVIGLRALVLYGLKGVAAYAHHAEMLGQESDEVYAGIEDTLDFLAGDPTDVGALLDKALELGTLNLTVMQMLDAGNTGMFGTPEPSAAQITPVVGKAILVSGHDMADLGAVLEQTAGTGINVYTHGELLPAHSYPGLKKYPHLVGNYGGAWQDQQAEFADFPGPILMTSNCIIEPAPSYRRSIFTTGPVGWPGLRHLLDRDFSILVQAALAMPGFTEEIEPKEITIGFGHNAVLGVADQIIEAVKTGAIKHFFLVGGCDGAASGRNYYSDLVESTPRDTVILTLGCAKFRFNKMDHGDIGGIPRLLDVGQCNDTYSAIQIAVALAEAFECGVNDLPLSFFVSWFEQKAVAVLLTLLALDIKGIHLGPTLPAFLTPAAVDILVDKFGIRANGDPATDMAAALAK